MRVMTQNASMPADLAGQIALAAEHKAALDGGVSALAHDHGDHVGAEVGQAAVGSVTMRMFRLKVSPKGDVDARPASPPPAGLRRLGRVQQQVLEHRH